jgi:hypothetical protein
MTLAEAQGLAGRLAAAFPRDWAFVGEDTNTIYVQKIAALDRYQAAADAIDDLIGSETRLPPIATILATYRQRWDRYSPAALEEAPLTEEQRAENLERLRELTGRFGVQDLPA